MSKPTDSGYLESMAGSLVINGAMNVFVVDGVTRDVFFGK